MSRPYPSLPKALIALFLLTCVCEYTTAQPRRPEDPNQDLEEENTLASFNFGRGRYYNYYERGSLLLDRDRYREARKDFREAIWRRPRDQWDARTYGMHFADYFPHRELGVAYCLQGELKTDVAKKKKLFRKAICQLKISLSQVESSKAKFYLNRARAGFWKATGTDITPPAVGIANDTIDRWQETPTLYINEYEAVLEIRARDDDSFVGTVWVDSFVDKEQPIRKKLFIESAEKTFERNTVVTLDANDKEKTVVVKAFDLAGNPSKPAFVRLIVDTVPPEAVARVHADESTLLGGRIPVEILARDDRGLKSVRVGDDPYDNRNCRGKLTWEGRFFADPGDRSLDVEITDRAGNVTVLTVTLESGKAMGIEYDERLTVYNASLYNNQKPWEGTFDITQRGSGNILGRLVQFSNLETNSFPPRLGHENLRGQVAYANRLLEPVSVYSVILALPENVYSPRDSAIRFASREEADKEKWHKEFWNDKYIYSVNLAPLVDANKPSNRSTEWEEVNKRVRNAMQNLKLIDQYTGKYHPRFDSKALKGWEAAKMYRNLRGTRLLPQRIDKTPPGELARSRAKVLFRIEPKQMESDLAFYGLFFKEEIEEKIKEEIKKVEMFTVKVNIIDRNFGLEPLFPGGWINIYAKIGDLQEGLKGKLKENMPRIIGEIKNLRVEREDIKFELEEDQRAFSKMCLQLYDKPASQVKCMTHLNKVISGQMTASIKKKGDRIYIRKNCKDIYVVSK